MLFVYGTYEHVSGFRVRISEFLNPKNWKIIDEDYDKEEK